LTTGWMFVYTIQPVVKPVVQPVWQPVVLYNQFDNQLYRVNGVLHSSLYVQLTVAHLSLGAVCHCCSWLPHSMYVLTVCPCGYVVVLVCWCVHNELSRRRPATAHTRVHTSVVPSEPGSIRTSVWLDVLHVANQATSSQLKIHQPNIYTLFWRFDLITRSSSQEAGTQFFRVLMRRSAVASRKRS